MAHAAAGAEQGFSERGQLASRPDLHHKNRLREKRSDFGEGEPRVLAYGERHCAPPWAHVFYDQGIDS